MCSTAPMRTQAWVLRVRHKKLLEVLSLVFIPAFGASQGYHFLLTGICANRILFLALEYTLKSPGADVSIKGMDG